MVANIRASGRHQKANVTAMVATLRNRRISASSSTGSLVICISSGLRISFGEGLRGFEANRGCQSRILKFPFFYGSVPIFP